LINKEINLDFDRTNRTGLSEAILCTRKSLAQLVEISQQIAEAGRTMLYTRLEADVFVQLEKQFPDTFDYDPVSRTAYQGQPEPCAGNPQVAIVTGGSSDTPIAREASRTLHFYRHPTLDINDAGVAGLWRITQALDELRSMKIIICVAGMDAALPTVLGGLVPGIIIAVPSSVGYGVARNGETALQALLCSCAPGLVVVNIDNGFGAACSAVRVLNNLTN
jgi:NCAIR mutase (PurE)-related protein